MKELFEYILIALVCPFAIPFIDLQEREMDIKNEKKIHK